MSYSLGLWKDVSCEKDVWLAFGCHPKSATDFSLKCYNGLRECLQHEKVVALGEIGLDYSGTLVHMICGWYRQLYMSSIMADTFILQLYIIIYHSIYTS